MTEEDIFQDSQEEALTGKLELTEDEFIRILFKIFVSKYLFNLRV